MSTIQIQGVPIDPDPDKVINIVSHDHGKSFLICVNFHPPLADVIFLFKHEKDRDEEFDNIQKQIQETK